jgi:hypothetical protein
MTLKVTKVCGGGVVAVSVGLVGVWIAPEGIPHDGIRERINTAQKKEEKMDRLDF